MTGERLQRARVLFEKLVDVPLDQRGPVLDQECAGDPPLRAFVEELLANEDRGLGGFLATPAWVADSYSPGAGEAGMPQRVGRYEVLRVIGEGGMGTVYEAQQDSPRRRVALKVIRPGLATGQMRRRFQREADLLGQLQHPGIAQVYEAGVAPVTTDTGAAARQPFFAMELIRGGALGEHAHSADLGPRERLELVARVCDAVQHAHQKGVIHRDLKPGNILVDESGQPKILDFGVARVTDADVRRVTLQTQVGQIVGTLAYMSPEQAAADWREVDTRSDVYSLGVILFELLARRPPHEFGSCSIAEALHRIRDEPPPRVGSIAPSLRGEVETIVARALEKDKTRRYQSASDLAADIRRYLRGEAIEAKRDSALYVLRKTVARYRGLVAVGALSIVLLAAFGIVSFVQGQRNRRLAETLTKVLAASQIEQGRLLGQTGSLATAEELLWREHLRDPTSDHSFWALWELYAHNPTLATLGTHGAPVRAVSYAPNGRRVATAGDDGVVNLWDTATLGLAATLTGHQAPVRGLDFSPDGRSLASASLDGTVIIWDLATLTPAPVLQNRQGTFYSVCYSRDGAQLACGAGDGAIHVLDAQTRNVVATLREHDGEVACVRFSPDGALLASGAADGAVRLWRDLCGPAIATLAGHGRGVASLAFSPDGRTLVSGSGDKTIKLWDLASRECTDTIDAANGTVRFLEFTADGRTLLVGGWWRIDAWDLGTRTRRPLAGHDVEAAATSPDGRFLVRGCSQARLWPRSAIRLEDITPAGGLMRLGESSDRRPAAVSPDGRLIATGDAGGKVCLWEVATGRLLASLEGHPTRWFSYHFHPAGRMLAVCSPGRIHFWDLTTGTLLDTLDGHHVATAHSLAFSPDGNTFTETRPDGSIQIRAVPTGAVAATIPSHQDEALSVRFSPDGRTIAATYRRGRIRWYSVQGDLQAEFDTFLTPWTVTFSPDGRQLAAACWSRQIQIWNLPSRSLELTLDASTAVIWEVAYMPGRPNLLASCSDDGLVQLWDLRGRRNVLTLARFDGAAISVAFTPDGKTLVAAADRTGPVHVWDLEYYERHMAGNLRFHMELLRPELGDAIQTGPLTAWADEVLRRPWPRIGPHAQHAQRPPDTGNSPAGVNPEVIAAWGNAAASTDR